MDRSGWLKSCRVFAAASRRAWGVQRAMRGCVSAHVGALSTPDRVRPLDRHVPRILQTYLHAGKLSPDRTYGQVRRLSRCFTLSLSRSRYSFSSSFLSFSSVVVQHPRLATHPLSLPPSLFFPPPRHHRDKNEIYGLFRGHLSLSLSFSSPCFSTSSTR